MSRRRLRRTALLSLGVIGALVAGIAPTPAAADDVPLQAFTTGVLGDMVWLDRDFDGVFDGGEVGLAGIDVTVSWNGGSNSSSTTTGADGTWTVGSLPFDIALTVTVDDTDLPGNMTPTHDLDDSVLSGPIATPHSAQVTLTAGAPTNTDLDFGYLGLGRVGDGLWLDVDGDGNPTPEPDDVDLAGVDVVVQWLNPNGGTDLEVTVATDGTGFWLVQGLPAGDVTVTPDPATLPGGVVAVLDADGGADGTVTVDLTDDPGTVGVDESVRTDLDFAYAGTGSISGLVWNDENGDGGSSGEPGIAATAVTLEWTDSVTSSTNTWSTTTDGSGVYDVTMLPAGFYRVSNPDLTSGGWSPTDDADGVADGAANLNLSAGQDMSLAHFGWRQTADVRVVASSLSTLRIGETGSFAVQVDNLGPGTATGPVVVVHDLGPGLVFDSVGGPGAAAWSCVADPAPSADTVRCTYTPGDLGVMGTGYDLVVMPSAAAAPTASLSSSVSSTSADPVAANDDHGAVASAPLAEINVAMTRLDALNAGALVTYRIVVSNDGPSPTNGAITLRDDLPSGLLFDDFSGAGWNCAMNSGDVVCVLIGTLGVGESSTVDLDLVVTASEGQSIVNSATATGGNEVGGTPLDQGAVDAEVGVANDGLSETVGAPAAPTTTVAPVTTTTPGATTPSTTPGSTTTTAPGATTTTSPGGSATTAPDGSAGGSGDAGTDLDGDGLPDELARTGAGEVLLWFVVLALSAGAIMTWATRPLRRPKAGAHWGQ